MHLLIDGYCENKELLEDEEHLRQVLAEYPGRISMTRISEPYVIRYDDCEPEEWGISGFVFLAESHIAIHTFVEQSYVNVDVFSCKDFDTDVAAEDLRKRFKMTKSRVSLAERGWSPPGARSENPSPFKYHGA
ncbi:MAG: S-adenosylmethionine decarboxylase [Dehalococcoidia bacterium]|nr:S-adenosylmethionine decarboxylase [Dehalococcoidia bacterium]